MKKADIKTKGRADYAAITDARDAFLEGKHWSEEEALGLLRLALRTVRLREPPDSSVEMLLLAGEMLLVQADEIRTLKVEQSDLRDAAWSTIERLRRSLG